MPVAKMAAFLEMPDTDFRTHLLCFKHKMKNVVWTKGTSGLDGELQSGSEVKYLIIIVLVECVSYLRFHRF
jgi:translation initiation factor 3 subunit L